MGGDVTGDRGHQAQQFDARIAKLEAALRAQDVLHAQKPPPSSSSTAPPPPPAQPRQVLAQRTIRRAWLRKQRRPGPARSRQHRPRPPPEPRKLFPTPVAAASHPLRDPRQQLFHRAVGREPEHSEEAMQRITRLHSRDPPKLPSALPQGALLLRAPSNATLVAMTLSPPLRLPPARSRVAARLSGGSDTARGGNTDTKRPHALRSPRRPASVLLQVMTERKQLRAALEHQLGAQQQHGPKPRSPPTKKAAELIASGRARLRLHRDPASARPAAAAVSTVASAREIEAAALVERLLAKVRAGGMSEEQLQRELAAAQAEDDNDGGGVRVPRHWLGQIRIAMKTAAWLEKKKHAPGLGKQQLIMPEAMAPSELNKCEADIDLELAIDMPSSPTARLAMEEQLRGEMAELLGVPVDQLEGMRLCIPGPQRQWQYESSGTGMLTFTRAHPDIELCAGGAEATKYNSADPSEQLTSRCVASEVVMMMGQGSGGSGGSRHSRHYAEFTVLEGWDLYFGVIRPGWDVEHGKNPQNDPESCWYYSANGACYPERNEAWEGIRGLDGAGPGTRVGMLLDLSVGSMTVYLNDKRLGNMVEGDAHGGQQGRGRGRLHGEYCWAVSMRYSRDAVRIAHVTEPEPPPA